MSSVNVAANKKERPPGRTIWREDGHDIRVSQRFDQKADIAFLHQDLSVIGPKKIPDAPDGVSIVNGAALDIRKRGYSTLRVERDGVGRPGRLCYRLNAKPRLMELVDPRFLAQ